MARPVYFGPGGCGTVFKMTPDGTTTILHPFAGGADGDTPVAPLLEANDGNLYGTTSVGGDTTCNCGLIFRITTGGVYTALHPFVRSEGGGPRAALIQASDGYLYGTTGNSIFRIALDGTGFKTLHDFSLTFTTEGGIFEHPLIQALDGTIYGTTCNGGTGHGGTAFKLNPDGSVTVLHTFTGGTSDGSRPCNGLLQGLDGNFYGLTQTGGISDSGTVFKMTPAGTVTILHSFSSSTGNGNPLYTSLIQSSDGNFFGNVESFVFTMTPDGTVTPLHTGGAFMGPLLHGRDGGLYGVESYGVNYLGDVFRLGNPASCDDALTLSDIGGTLHLGFTLKSQTPASWSAWIGIQGHFYNLWSGVALPAITPALFFDLPIASFPPVGRVVMITTLSTGAGVCLDWKTVNTQ